MFMAALPCAAKMKKGFSTLFIVILLGSLSLGLILMLTNSSFLAVKTGTDDKSSSQSKALINACAEIALENIRENNTWLGTNSVKIDGNLCTYNISGSGSNRTILASGNFNNMFRKVEVQTTALNPIVVSTWQEIQ